MLLLTGFKKKTITGMKVFVMTLACILFAIKSSLAMDMGPWKENPFYWSLNGVPTLLLGGNSDNKLFQLSAADLGRELDLLKDAGGNYVRNTMSSRDDSNIWPFAQTSDGKYDLLVWDEEYWQNVDRLLAETAAREIVVQVEIWATFDFYRSWDRNPFNPILNVNYTVAESGLPDTVTTHPANRNYRHPFFRSVPKELDLQALLFFQKRYVEKLLDHTLKYDHILYCIDNETTVTPRWGEYWAELLRNKASATSKKIMITEMWDAWDIRRPEHRSTFDHPEIYDYVEVSQNNHQQGQTHYDRLMWLRSYLRDNPRPMNSVKIYGADGSKWKSATSQDGEERFWRGLFAGLATSRFHRPPAGLGIGDRALQHIRAAKQFFDDFPPFLATPSPESIINRSANEAYVLRNENSWAIYFPPAVQSNTFLDQLLSLLGGRSDQKRQVSLIKSDRNGFSVKWFSIERAVYTEEYTLPDGNKVRLSPPAEGHWIALVQKSTIESIKGQ